MATVTDPVADMLARIRNGSLAEHEKVDIPSSKLRVRLAEILKEEGFIKNFRLIEDKRQGVLRVYLKYGPGQGAGDQRAPACLEAGASGGTWARTGFRACSGDGGGDPVHAHGRAHGPGVPQGQGGREVSLLRLVARPSGPRWDEGRDDVEDRAGSRSRSPRACRSASRGSRSRSRAPRAASSSGSTSSAR